MAVVYPQLESIPPQVYTADHWAEVDRAMRELAIIDHLLQKCERCKMPVEALRAECDGACQFFQALQAEYRGLQATNPPPLGG